MARARSKALALATITGAVVIALMLVELTRVEANNDSEAGDRPFDPRRRPDVEESPRSSDDRGERGPVVKPTNPPSNPTPREAGANKNQLRRDLQHKFGRSKPREAADEDGPSTDELDPPPVPPASWTSLPEQYVGDIIREQLIPLAQSCYEDIAPEGTHGALSLSVAVIGDADLGGVIDRVDVNHDESSIEGELTECVRFAAYDMQFDPPQEGRGVQEFDFTIEFARD